jgi:thiol:disulfide interchange protein DsbG
MLKNLIAVVAAGCILLLASCKDDATTPTANQASAAPVSIARIQEQAKGFSVGALMSARTVYVFFDPQCPHCTDLWKAAKPLKDRIHFYWIPVGILNASSASQGATILATPDPEAAMEAHEASMTAKSGGITASRDIDQSKAAVIRNTQLLTSFGFASIPTIVTAHAQTDALITHEGAMSTQELAHFLGLAWPADAKAASTVRP